MIGVMNDSNEAVLRSHIHFICPQQIEEALASGVTTMTEGELVRDRYKCNHLYARS